MQETDTKIVGGRRLRTVRRIVCVLAVFAIAVCALAMLSGCKYTDVLTQHIEDPVNGTVDQNAKPIYKEKKNAQKANRVSHIEGKTKNKDKQKEQTPQYSKNAKSKKKTDQRKQSKDSSHTQRATEGTKTSQNKGRTKSTSKSSKTKGNAGKSKSTKSNAKSKKASNSGKTSNKGKSSAKSKSASSGGTGKVYNDGTYEQLPDNVKTVAAAGQYATLVQMLAGADGPHLVAADSAWLSRVKSFGAFSGEGIEKVATGWKGSDNSANSTGSAANAQVKAIIKAKPDAVLVDGNDEDSNLSAAAKKRLTKAGIDVVTVPELGSAFTTDANVKQAAKIVGKLLSNATNGYSAQMASSYVSFHDQIASSNGDFWYKPGYAYRYQKGESTAGTAQTGAATTVFVDHITQANKSTTTADRRYSPYGGTALYLDGETIEVSDGVGMSLSGTGKAYALMDYYLQLGGVVNNSYERVQPGSKAYPIVAGQDAHGLVDAANRETPSALWYAPTSDTAAITVGDEAFPAIVARNKSIANTLQTSASKVNGLYNIGQAYDIYVMPTGLSGNWADGTVESFLIQPWAATALTSSSPTSADKAAVRSSVQSFYTTFYRASNTKTSHWVKNSVFNRVHVSANRS